VIAIKEAASKMDFRADGSNIKKKKKREMQIMKIEMKCTRCRLQWIAK
jgi:hypothetical protein